MDKKLLIIGSLPIENIKSTYGGTTVLLQQLVDYCDKNNIDYHLVQTNIIRGKFALVRNWFSAIYRALKVVNKCDFVMFNAASNGLFYFAPFVYFIAKVYNKKFILRKFGGGAIDLYSKSNWIKKKILQKTIFKSDYILLETKQIVKYFQKIPQVKSEILWYPNYREQQSVKRQKRDFQKKFVFISYVKKTKGVDEILALDKLLPQGYLIDIYGPINTDDYKEQDLVLDKVKYRGVIKPTEVVAKLSEYDVLLLPTFHEGEGYPGIILEAFSMGIPVISTYWRAVPEIVKEGENGLLIKPKDIEGLKDAVLFFSQDNYFDFSNRALSFFEENLEIDTVNESFFKFISS